MDHGHTVFQRVLWPREINFLSIQQNNSLILLICPEQALHHGGFSGSVLTHKAHDRAFLHIKVDMIENTIAPE